MSVSHKNMPDSERHEPKGASSAASGQVYVSNGLGGGSWTDQLATIKNRNKAYLFGEFEDISVASSIFIPNPILGTISKIYVTFQDAIATTDCIITAKINGVLVTGSSITATSAGSVAGSTFTSSPTGANSIAAGGAIEITSDGGPTSLVKAIVCIVVDVA